MEKSTSLFLYSLAGTAAFVSLSSFQDIKDEKKGEGKNLLMLFTSCAMIIRIKL